MKQKKPLNLNPFVLIFAVVVVAWLFTFIITANLAVTLLADGIDFINKNDTWSFLLRLFEQVTDLGSTHTYEHFDKF